MLWLRLKAGINLLVLVPNHFMIAKQPSLGLNVSPLVIDKFIAFAKRLFKLSLDVASRAPFAFMLGFGLRPAKTNKY